MSQTPLQRLQEEIGKVRGKERATADEIVKLQERQRCLMDHRISLEDVLDKMKETSSV